MLGVICILDAATRLAYTVGIFLLLSKFIWKFYFFSPVDGECLILIAILLSIITNVLNSYIKHKRNNVYRDLINGKYTRRK